MSPGTPPVREMAAAELDAVVALHRDAFPQYQSTLLGPGFCRRLLRAYDDNPAAVVLVALNGGGHVVGYLVGARPADQRGVNDRLLGWAALASVSAALRSPSQALAKVPGAARRGRRAAGALVARVTRRSRTPATPSVPVVEANPRRTADARVVLVAVAGTARGAGHGDRLLEAFAHWAAREGHRWADLSVIADNRAACAAYERNAWISGGLEGEGTTLRYWLDLAEAPTSGS